MVLDDPLAGFGSVPFTHGALVSKLADYRRPNDKIARWLANGDLLSLRRGLYLAGQRYRSAAVSGSLVANLLYGPSYVSLESALAWHGLIPEGVMHVTSVTTRRAREISTPLGTFSYTHLPLAFYRIGIAMFSNDDGTAFLMATPEKALCDKVALTRRLDAVSTAAMRSFLFDDLRIEPTALAGFDPGIVLACSGAGFKKRQLMALLKVVELSRGSH